MLGIGIEWIEIGIIGLILGLQLLFLGILLLIGYFLWSNMHKNEIEPEEDIGKDLELVERGRMGGINKGLNSKDMAQAQDEARGVLLSKGSMEQKKEGFIGIIQKYPHVAEALAKRLNRQYGIAEQLGIEEGQMLSFVRQIAHEAMSRGATPQQKEETGAGYF